MNSKGCADLKNNLNTRQTVCFFKEKEDDVTGLHEIIYFKKENPKSQIIILIYLLIIPYLGFERSFYARRLSTKCKNCT